MAPSLAGTLAPLLADLTLRHVATTLTSTSTAPGGKTPEQYATEGRFSYVPSFPAAVIFLALFLILLLANLFLMFRHRAWFWWVMNWAVAMELVGYVARAISIKHLDQKNVFIIQTVFLLVAPAVMAAACYMAFGRVVLWVTPPQYQSAHHLWLPARRITPLFVSCDILSFFVQIVGGGMAAAANTTTQENNGKNVVLVGLSLQLATFGFFVLASIRFSVVLRTKLRTEPLPTERNWRLFLTVINVASVIILVRTVARFMQFVLGTPNFPDTHEWYFYIFDSVPMFAVGAVCICIHPGYYLPYLGIRRRNLQFSKNADSGPLSRLARGRARVGIPSEDRGTAEMVG